jgi:hypothetical protein
MTVGGRQIPSDTLDASTQNSSTTERRRKPTLSTKGKSSSALSSSCYAENTLSCLKSGDRWKAGDPDVVDLTVATPDKSTSLMSPNENISNLLLSYLDEFSVPSTQLHSTPAGEEDKYEVETTATVNELKVQGHEHRHPIVIEATDILDTLEQPSGIIII